MKKMKAPLIAVITICIAACMLVACTSTMSYTFNISNDDKIKVILDTSDGYSISQADGEFTISKEDAVITNGFFMLQEVYEEYFTKLSDSENVRIIEESTKNENKYLFYEYAENGALSYNIIVQVNGSITGVALANTTSEESARACFDLLTFEKAEK